MVYKFFSSSTNIRRGLSAYKPQKLVVYCLNNSTIRSVLHYVSSVWTSCDKENLGRVLKLQKRPARVISDADNQASSVKLFNRLQWLPFYEESKIAKCCIEYKRIKGEVLLYTEGSLILNSQQHNRATRYLFKRFFNSK